MTGQRRGKSELLYCTFCGKPQNKVQKLIAGPGVYICDECIDLCNEIISEMDVEAPAPEPVNTRSPATNFTPTFQTDGIECVTGKCFYIGPFSEPFNEIYAEFIALPLRREGYVVERGDEIFKASAVIEEIWEGIYSSELIIAELTAKNPNVLYEAGIAHAIGRPVVLIAQSAEDVPFDLRHRRCIIYDYTPGGCRKLENDILAAVRRLIGTRVDDGSTW